MEMFIGMETGQVATGAQLIFHVVIQSLRHVKSLQPHGLQHARGISLITFHPFTNFFDVKEIDFPLSSPTSFCLILIFLYLNVFV